MELKEFRTKYPQYDNRSDLELTSALHKKYYADKMSLNEFGDKVGVPITAQALPLQPAQQAPTVDPSLTGIDPAQVPSIPTTGALPAADPMRPLGYEPPPPKPVPTWGEVGEAILPTIVGGIQQSEGGVLQHMAQLQRSGLKTSFLGLPGMAAEVASKLAPTEAISKKAEEIGKGIAESGRRKMELARPKHLENLEPFDAKSAVFYGATSLGRVAPFVALGGPLGAWGGVSALGVSAAGTKFDEMVNKGYDPEKAAYWSAFVGAMEAGTERIPMGYLFKGWSKGIAKNLFKFAITETGQEATMEVVDSLVDKVTVDPNMTLGDFSRRMQTMLASLPIALGGMTAVGKSIQLAQGKPGAPKLKIDKVAVEEITKHFQDQQTREELFTMEDAAPVKPDFVETVSEAPQEVVPQAPAVPEAPLAPESAQPGATATPKEITQPPESLKVAGTNLEPFLTKLNSGEDAQAVFNRIVEMNAGQIEDARRGKMTMEEIEGLAKDYGFEHIKQRKKGEAWGPEQYEAARTFMDYSLQEVTASAAKAESKNPEDLLAFQSNLDTFVEASKQILGARAEWGRTGAVMRKQAMSTDYIQSMLEKMGGADNIANKAQVLLDLQQNGLPPQEISKAAAQLQKASITEKVIEVWKVGLLTGLQTHAVNISSNALNVGLSIPEQYIAAVRGKFHGGDKVYFREANARAYGLMQGFGESARYAWEAFKTGQPIFDEETKVNEINKRRIGAVGTDPDSSEFARHTGNVVRLPFRALTSMDEFFKSTARGMELKGRAMRQAIQEGKGSERAAEIESQVRDLYGKVKPKVLLTKEDKALWAVHDAVFDYARYITFQTKLGPAGQKFTGMLRDLPALQVVAPFVRTPVNIVKFGTHRTPMALAMPSFWKQYKKGGAERDVAIARMVTGSGIMASVMYMAAQGVVSGGGPSDSDERRVWLKDNQPYSIKYKGEWNSFSRVEPLGFLFGISADLQEAGSVMFEVGEKEDQDKVLKALGIVYTSVVKNMASKTFLKGITDAVAAYYDPDRYGQWWIRNLAGSTIPAFIAHNARAPDPYLREAKTILDQLKSRLPGLRQTLLPKRGVFGEKIPSNSSWFPDIVSPVYTRMDTNDPFYNELLALEVFPSRPSRKIGGVELTPKQYDRYQQIAGERAKEIITGHLNNPDYKNTPAYVQKDLLRRAFVNARKFARYQFPELLEEKIEKKLDKFDFQRKEP